MRRERCLLRGCFKSFSPWGGEGRVRGPDSVAPTLRRTLFLEGRWGLKYVLMVVVAMLGGQPAKADTIHSQWVGPASGNWSVAENWSPVGVPDNNVNDVYRVIIGSEAVRLDRFATIDDLFIGNGASLFIAAGRELTVTAVPGDGIDHEIENDGIIEFDAAGVGATLRIDGVIGYRGIGKFIFGDNTLNGFRTGSAARLMILFPETLRLEGVAPGGGRGDLGSFDGLYVRNYSRIDIFRMKYMNLNAPARDEGYWRNLGTIHIENSTGTRLRGMLRNQGGRIELVDAGLSLEDATIFEGILMSDGNSKFSTSNTTIRDVTLSMGSTMQIGSRGLFVEGNTTINGTLIIYGQLVAAGGDARLSGTGEIRFNRPGSGSSGIRTATEDDRLIITEGASLTMTAEPGSGAQLGGDDAQFDQLKLRNLGSIELRGIEILRVEEGTYENAGQLRATGNGRVLLLGSTILNELGLVPLNGGVAAQEGGTIRAESGSSVELYTGGRIVGGIIDTDGGTILSRDGAVEDVTNRGTLTVPPSGSLTIVEALHNDGVLATSADTPGGTPEIVIEGDVTIDGGGQIDMTLRSAQFVGIPASTASGAPPHLIIENNTVRGTVLFGSASNPLAFTNRGTIVADQSPATKFESGPAVVTNEGVILIQTFFGDVRASGTFVNRGLVNITDESSRLIAAHYVQEGGSTISRGILPARVTINDGELEFVGTSTSVFTFNGGTLRIGNGADEIVVRDWYTQGPGATVEIELGGFDPGVTHDRMRLNTGFATLGTTTLAGTVRVLTIGGFEPQPGDEFVIIEYGDRTGGTEFDAVINATPFPQVRFEPVYGPPTEGHVTLRVSPSGDLNDDGSVNLDDYAAFEPCLVGPSAIPPDGCNAADSDGDGRVTLRDYAGLQAAFTGP